MKNSLVWLVLPFCAALEVEEKKCRVKYDLSRCYSTKVAEPMDSIRCRRSATCRKSIKVTYIHTEPYNVNLVRFLFSMCCGNCTNVSVNNHFKHLSEVLKLFLTFIRGTEIIHNVFEIKTSKRVLSKDAIHQISKKITLQNMVFLFSAALLTPVLIISPHARKMPTLGRL